MTWHDMIHYHDCPLFIVPWLSQTFMDNWHFIFCIKVCLHHAHSSEGGDIVRVGVTFGPGLHDLAHHAVPVLVDADHLELVGGARAQIVNLNFPGVWRIYRKLNPVRHPGVFFTVPDIKVVKVSGVKRCLKEIFSITYQIWSLTILSLTLIVFTSFENCTIFSFFFISWHYPTEALSILASTNLMLSFLPLLSWLFSTAQHVAGHGSQGQVLDITKSE